MRIILGAKIAAFVLAGASIVTVAHADLAPARTSERQAAADGVQIFKAANAFYAVSTTFKNGGVPDAAGLAKLQPVVSANLHALLVEAGKAEERHTAATKNEEPPLMQGDIFSSLFEGVSEFKVESCENSNFEAGGVCKVKLTYDPKGKPVTWTDTALLVKDAGGWRVDDIEYGSTWDFGNKGKLSDNLKAVIAQVPSK
jgi:hypothetical protein